MSSRKRNEPDTYLEYIQGLKGRILAKIPPENHRERMAMQFYFEVWEETIRNPEWIPSIKKMLKEAGTKTS